MLYMSTVEPFPRRGLVGLNSISCLTCFTCAFLCTKVTPLNYELPETGFGATWGLKASRGPSWHTKNKWIENILKSRKRAHEACLTSCLTWRKSPSACSLRTIMTYPAQKNRGQTARNYVDWISFAVGTGLTRLRRAFWRPGLESDEAIIETVRISDIICPKSRVQRLQPACH